MKALEVCHTTSQGWGRFPGSYLKRIIPSTDADTDSQRLPAGVGEGPPWQLDMLALIKERQKYKIVEERYKKIKFNV